MASRRSSTRSKVSTSAGSCGTRPGGGRTTARRPAARSSSVRRTCANSNPALAAKKPRQPRPQPDPPSPDQAARIIEAAWAQDHAWGTFVWLTMVTGMRRGELLALRWDDVDLAAGMLEIRRNYVWVGGRGIEKDTKTHQMRRIALDEATVEVLARTGRGRRR